MASDPARSLIGKTRMNRREGVVGAPAGASARDLTAADYRATRQFAQTAFGRIAYVERGVGRPALFLHGFPLGGMCFGAGR